ncbi:unnamed protein product [Schistocephalus solidus]|uniref:CBS domain-containing protein n=1 Tax=Schistocephalus solidus TaxID=70667 RepID=A0A183T7U5_SCHSO|nr:unnamed protein product [Schistocephalus solidus]
MVTQFSLQLHTASDIIIISERLWQSLGGPTMQQTSHSATSACGGLIRLMEQLQCCVAFRGTTSNAICYVTKSDLNLLSLDWIEQLTQRSLQSGADSCRAHRPHHGNSSTDRFSAPRRPRSLHTHSSRAASASWKSTSLPYKETSSLCSLASCRC